MTKVLASRFIPLLLVGTAAGAAQAGPLLAGNWVSPDLRIAIDEEHARASVDDGPWEPFELRTAATRMIVFAIGSQQYIGLLQDETLTVTRQSDPTSKTLTRSDLRWTLRE